MKDVLVVLVVTGFFAACVAYVTLCDRIVGADQIEPEPEPELVSEATS